MRARAKNPVEIGRTARLRGCEAARLRGCNAARLQYSEAARLQHGESMVKLDNIALF
jgi:hypothetical protein